MSNDRYWEAYAECLDKVRTDGKTVGDVIRICNEYFPPSVCEAFFPGGGDRSLLGTLIWDRLDWATVWVEADYYWCARDANGDTVSYIEGDIERGDCRRTKEEQ